MDPVDSTLRDFCGQCVREFLKWSIKQSTPQQQEKSPVNTKSLFKRLYSLALHPNAFKRLGAALAFNNIYREFRLVNLDKLDKKDMDIESREHAFYPESALDPVAPNTSCQI